jgi:hypothetical protein
MSTQDVATDVTGRSVVSGTRADTEPMDRRTMARDHDHEIEVPISKDLNFTRDRVRWGPVLAGLFTALTTMVALALLGAAIGLTAMNAGTAAIQGGAPPDAGRNAAIWGAISAIIAFLWGGYVAGRSSAVFDRTWGALNGALVFLIAVPVGLWLAGQGFGAVMGTMTNLSVALGMNPAASAQQAASSMTPYDVAQTAERARTAAVVTLLGMVCGFVAAGVGGALGTRRTLEVDLKDGEVRDAA